MLTLIFILLLATLAPLQLSADTRTNNLLGNQQDSNRAEDWNNLAESYKEKDDTTNLRLCAHKAYLLAQAEKNKREEGGAIFYKAMYEYATKRKATELYEQLLLDASRLLESFPQSHYYLATHHSLSQVYNRKGLHDKALAHLHAATIDAPADYDKLANLYCDLAYSHLYKGTSDSVIYYTEKAINMASARKDTLPLTVAYSLRGILYRRQNNFTSALEHYLKTAELYNATMNWSRLVTTWCNIAVLYTDWEKYDSAIQFAEKAVAVVKEHNLPDTDMAKVLLIQGAPLMQLNRVEQALLCYKKSLPLIETSYQRRSCLFGLTKSFYELGQRDSSSYYMEQLEEEFHKSKAKKTDSYYVFKGYTAFKEGDYSSAIENYEKVVTINKSKAAGTIIRDDVDKYLILSDAYAKGPKDYEKALHYKKIAFDLQDSIKNRENQELLSAYYAQYQTAEKELEINRLELEKQKSANVALLFVIACGIAIIALTLVALYSNMRRLRKEKEATLLAQRIKEKENDFLLLQQETDKRLTRKYIDGLETERERLSQELHDDVCNSLLGFEMRLLSQNNNLSKDAAEDLKLLSTIREHVRHISHELMPPAFQYATIDEMLAEIGRASCRERVCQYV